LFITQEVQTLTGITPKLCDDYGEDFELVLVKLKQLTSVCSFIVAHNSDGYDRLILERFVKLDVPFIDSKKDIKYPPHVVGKRLIYLVAEMGCQVMKGHHALADCLMLLDVIKQTSFEDMLKIVEHRKNNRLQLVKTDV
jgi:hypothetical protein